MRERVSRGMRVSFGLIVAVSGLMALEALAGDQLPPEGLDWEVTTQVDCVSPFDPRVRARVVSHRGGPAGAIHRLTVLQDAEFLASDTSLKVSHGPEGTLYAGARMKLLLRNAVEGRIRGELTNVQRQVPVAAFDCGVLR